MTQTPCPIHALLEAWAERTPAAAFVMRHQGHIRFVELQATVDCATEEVRTAGVRSSDRILLVPPTTSNGKVLRALLDTLPHSSFERI